MTVERYRARVNELAACARFRTDLLAMIAHDLRSPLTAAVMSVDFLTERAATRTDAQLADDLGVALLRMRRILDALCDETGVEPAGLWSAAATEDVLGLATAIAGQHAQDAARKGVQVRVLGEATATRCDAGRLAHAIDNLVANALKHARRGGRVEIHVAERGETLRLEVEDDGPGVAFAQPGRLFGPEGGADPDGRGANGLGLYIARRMVDLHGGIFGVEPGTFGTRFWFEIPSQGVDPDGSEQQRKPVL